MLENENDDSQSDEIDDEQTLDEGGPDEGDAVRLIELLDQQTSLSIESSSSKDGGWATRLVQTVRNAFSSNPIPYELLDKTVSETPTKLLQSARGILEKTLEILIRENTMAVPPMGGPAIVLDADKIIRTRAILEAVERALSERG